MSTEKSCVICNGETECVFSAKLMSKHEVKYYFCNACGHLRTEHPYWLEEAYSSPIAAADTGLVQRNLQLSRKLACILFYCFDPEGKYLDKAGGTGLLVRLMRDIGFDFYWEDEFCKNEFARGFEATREHTYTAITAFEVMEHLTKPLPFIEDVLSRSTERTLIFSTQLFQGAPPKPDEWWYYAFETGQHVSFYQKSTLEFIANKLGVNYYGVDLLHILTQKTLLARQLSRILKHSGKYCSKLSRQLEPLTMRDHEGIMKGAIPV